MKLSLFATALISLLQYAEAVTLEGVDFDLADYELAEDDATELAQVYDDDVPADFQLAELYGEDWELREEYDLAEVSSEFSDSSAEIEELAESDAEEDDSEYELAQLYGASEGEQCDACAKQGGNAVTLSMEAPKCEPKEEKKEPFEKAMLSALNELGNKSSQLATALEMQFKKNEKLAASNTMQVSGSIQISPNAAASLAAKKK